MLRQILIDAIECWQSMATKEIADESYTASSRERLYREASLWIFGKYKNAPFFSFAQVCECLGLDPDFIRRRLLRSCTKSEQRKKENVRAVG